MDPHNWKDCLNDRAKKVNNYLLSVSLVKLLHVFSKVEVKTFSSKGLFCKLHLQQKPASPKCTKSLESRYKNVRKSKEKVAECLYTSLENRDNLISIKILTRCDLH